MRVGDGPIQHLRANRRVAGRVFQVSATVGMGRDEDRAQAVGFGPQKTRLVHPEAIATKAKDQHVAGVGVDFGAGQHEDSVAFGQVGGVVR